MRGHYQGALSGGTKLIIVICLYMHICSIYSNVLYFLELTMRGYLCFGPRTVRILIAGAD